MFQDSLDKIKQAEKEAREIVDNANQKMERAVISEKEKWENKFQEIKDSSDKNLIERLADANKEAQRIKQERNSEIENNINNIKHNSSGKIDDAVRFVVEKFVTRYK